MKITEFTMSINGEPKKVQIGEEFEMNGKKYVWQYKDTEHYAVTLVEIKPKAIRVTDPEWMQKAYNDLVFSKLNPEE